MATQDRCPTTTEAKDIAAKRDTTLDLPAAQRLIKPWAAGLTELAPTDVEEDTKHRYADIRAYVTAKKPTPTEATHVTQHATQPAAQEAIRSSSRLLRRENRETQSPPTKTARPKAGTKRNTEGRQIQTIPKDIVRTVGLDLPGLSSWKVDKACRCKPKDLGSILGAMYGHQEAITSIDGWRWDGINKENYYKVHWKPTVIDRWALPLCAEEGYTPTHIEPISREEAKDVCTCELCWLPRGDSPMCHNCKRAYHPACLEEALLSGHKEPGHWLCPICKFGSNEFKTTMRLSAHSDLIRVHWRPTLEPAPLITAHLDYLARRSDYEEENKRIQEARYARPDTQLPTHTRQGLPDPHTWLPRCNNLHSKATFHTYPINPQTDIVGTGKCETFLQLHPHMTTPAMNLSMGEPIMPKHDLVQHVTVHDESGRTIGLLTKQQHQHLHAWLQHTPHTRNLATELVALLRRQDTQSSRHPMRLAQDKALTTLHTTRSFPSTVQRWADPLTVRPETTTYWSPDINDTAFGAHHNCLLVRHTGLSTWNVPDDDAVALKCVNHAIHSAHQEEAMATIMLIPGKKGTSYPKHIDTLRRYPEYCQHLASIPLNNTNCSKLGKHATLLVYVIWNEAGQLLTTKGNPQGWMASIATALHPDRETHPLLRRPHNQKQPAALPSGHKQHLRLPLDRALPTLGHTRSQHQLTHHSTTLPRMAITEWTTIAYTDGSCIKTSEPDPARVGAGVYIPESNALLTIAMNDPENNTINKAELTAIHAALKAGARRIATDSLCSLYQIRRALANPMSLINHRHNDILTDIATLIIASPVTTQFYKVRAHSGIIGNEGADALAKHAALHPEQANTLEYHPTTPKERGIWLNHGTDSETLAPLPDCRQSVRAHMHSKHKLGLANQDSIYYQMTQEITKAAAKGAGERVMTDATISIPAQRTALLYRTGGLYNQKLAMRWKQATDDRCPLCGEADSATHLLSGCNETLPLVQERHNGAGRLIAKAISKGTLGGCIRFADTGSWEKGARENLDLPNDTLHSTLRALGMKPTATKNTTRPDIIMVTPRKKTGKRGTATKQITIIEIKYCADSRWMEQLDKALNQHTKLAHTMRKIGHMVEIRPILLGVDNKTQETQALQDAIRQPDRRRRNAIPQLAKKGICCIDRGPCTSLNETVPNDHTCAQCYTTRSSNWLATTTRHPHTHSNLSEDEQPNYQPRPLREPTLHALHAGLLPCTRYPHTHGNQPEQEQPNDQPMTPLGSALHALNAILLPRTRHSHTHSNQTEDEQPPDQPRPLRGTTLHASHAALLPRTELHLTEMPTDHPDVQADNRHGAQPHHLPALTATALHDQLAVTAMPSDHADMQADNRHGAQPHHHLPALTATALHDQLAVTEMPTNHADMQADNRHGAQPHHHLPALTATALHDQLAVTAMPTAHPDMQADNRHGTQPHHHLPALTATALHDQLAVTAMPSDHADMQADNRHGAQPHHHLPALTATALHDQLAVTAMPTDHPDMQADNRHGTQPHHHLPALTATALHDQLAVTAMPSDHADMQADKRHGTQPHHHLPALTATALHDQLAVTAMPSDHANMQADNRHGAQPHHHLPALTATALHDQLAVTEMPTNHADMQADNRHGAQPHHHLPALTATALHDQLAVTAMPTAHPDMQADNRHGTQPHHHLPALTATALHDQLAVTAMPSDHADMQADKRHGTQPHHHLPALTATALHDQLAVTAMPSDHANMQADNRHGAQPHHYLPALTATALHDQLAVTEMPTNHADMQADNRHGAQPHHHLPALTATALHAQLAVTEMPTNHADMQADNRHGTQPHHHLPALTATALHDQLAVTEMLGTTLHDFHADLMPRTRYPHTHSNQLEDEQLIEQPRPPPGPALRAFHANLMPRTRYPHTHSNQPEDEQPNEQPRPTQGTTLHAVHADLLYHHLPGLTAMPEANQQPQHDANMLGAHTIGQRMVPETNITEAPWLCTYSDNMEPQYTIIIPMPNPPFGHPNWKPTQQKDTDWQTIAYLVCFLTWIMITRKRNEPTYTHAKSKQCLKKQRKTLAKLNASLHTTTYNWLLGIDGTLQRATTITRLTNTTCTYLKGHNSGRTIRAIQYNTTLQAYMTYYLNPNIISNPTWNMAIIKYMARCIYISWLLLAAGDIEENPGPDGLHFEQQVASHCQIHALNMAAEHSWLTNKELANFHTSELHARRGDQRTMWALARDEQGACNDTVINLYLMSHYGLSTHTVAHLRTRRDWSICNLDALSVTHGTNAFLCKAPAHSMAVRKHNGAWYLLDSQADAPIRLRNTRHYAYPVTCEIQAIISASDYTAEMEEARQKARLGPIIGNPQEAHRPYWEKQYKKCCLAHAINMAMGKPMIRPDDVITHCKTLGTHIQDLANQARQVGRPIPLRSGLPHIYEEPGNFTISTMNHYLYHYHRDLHLCPTATELTLGNITPELLTTLTGNILYTDSYTNTAAILITNNHATTIRRTDRAWQWLDSERGHPCRLDTPEDWLQLHGTLVQIKKGDAANTNLIQPLCWLADPTRHATMEQLEQHLRTAHIDLTNHDPNTQPAHSPRTDRPLPNIATEQPHSYNLVPAFVPAFYRPCQKYFEKIKGGCAVALGRRNDVLNLVHQHSPDILILTETMTQPRSNNPDSGWLKRVMPDYTTHRHSGHSEVLIGIKHNLALQMQTKMLPPCADAEVNARCVILTLNQHQCEQLTIIATYWPSWNNGDALSLREKMQQHIRTSTGHLPGSLILAGDINATLRTADRSEHTDYTQDLMMRDFAAELRLLEADPDDRAWTYQQPHCNSRIDAILTRDARHGPEHRTHVKTHAYLSDHRPVTATLSTARLGIVLADPQKPHKHSHTILTTPITNKDREAYRLAVQQPSS
ncbi:hypothetical protein QJQ45_030292, partial [Haematococcus lacustris]